jgi:hypothetical protein
MTGNKYMTGSNAHRVPVKAKCLNELFQWCRKPVRLCCPDIYSPFHFRAIRSIKYKDGDNRQGQDTTETVEEDAECRIFTCSGAKSQPNLDRCLRFIHPNTKQMNK